MKRKYRTSQKSLSKLTLSHIKNLKFREKQ